MKIYLRLSLLSFCLAILLSCSKEKDTTSQAVVQIDLESQVKKLSYFGSLESLNSFTLKDGLLMHTLKVKNKADNPIAFYIVEMDLSKKNMLLKTISMSTDSLNYELGTVRQMAENSTYRSKILLAVNGDFFAWQGKPWGPLVHESKIIHDGFFDSWHSFFGVREDGSLFIGGKENFAKQKQDFVEAIGGVEKLLSNYAMVSHANSERHPRTALGFTDDKFYLLVVDGRQPAHSIGMTLREMSELFFSLRMKEALNLDGGGSSTLLLREGSSFTEANSYSDAAPRAVADGLAIIESE